MVLKPSEHTPLSALELGSIAQRVGLPNGVLNVVTGTGVGAGKPLSLHPSVRKLAFTGSVATGQEIMTAAARDIKNVSLELGGKSPLVIFADTEVDAAVEWIMFGGFWNHGQVCSATTRVLVQSPLFDRVLERLVVEARRIKIGAGLDPGVRLGPLVSESQLKKVQNAVQSGRREGARLVTGGRKPAEHEVGYFFKPTIFVDAPIRGLIWNEEIFGPVISLRSFESEDEAVRLANDTPFGLAAAVMSKDTARLERVAAALDAGVVWMNCSQPTFVEAPWGGTKRSGIGRELGRWGLDTYFEVKQMTAYASSEPWGWYLAP